MEELYIEGLANHDDPESCVSAREGDGEALTGDVQAGLLSRVIREFGVPTLSTKAEGNTTRSAIASSWWTPRGQRTMACTYTSMRENREVSCSPVWMITRRAAQGRPRSYA